MQTVFKRFFTLLILTLILSCANRGTPSGGEKDITPPEIIESIPENFSTNFKGNEIIIRFNEYVKIKNVQKQLVISPPMDTKPEIYPLGGASKYISIKIKDTLDANTTYAFNFGESIVDNNEENPYPYYRYVFSTGETIDSLSVKGYVTDALKRKADEFISVMLYEIDSTYSDSIVFKDKPRYTTNTLDSLTTFSIDNIKAGTYKLVAIKDKNTNYLFNQKTDKIGFVDTHITVPTDSVYKLNLFYETIDFKAYKPKQVGEQRIIFPFEGDDYKSTKIKIQENTSKDFKYRIIKDAKTDTLYYWYSPKFEIDSTRFVVSNKKYSDTLKHKFRALDTDSLKLNTLSSSVLNFDEDFTVEGNVPFETIDASKIKLITKDSVEVPFTVKYDSVFNRFSIPIKKEENQGYNLTIYPEAITDFFNIKNKDTLKYTFKTKLKSEYGNMRVNLINAKFPLIVQLVDKDGVVLREQYTTKSPTVDFNDLLPKQYELRVIYDANKNGKYDTGNYLLGLQPERVSYSPPIDEVRASFDNIIDFTLLD